MKKVFKSRIFSFILGAVIFSGISVCAYSLSSNDISFTPENSNWQVSNVEEAIDDLYKKTTKDITLSYNLGTNSESFTSYDTRLLLSGYRSDYKYFMIINAAPFSGCESKCVDVYFSSKSDVTTGNLNVNTQYSLSDYNVLHMYTTGSIGCFYEVTVKFYN